MFTRTRLKLTAWYLLTIMTVSLSLSVFIYRTQVREIERLERAWQMRTEERFFVFRRSLSPPQLPEGAPQRFIIPDPELLENARRRLITLLVLVNGTILIASGGLGFLLAGKTLKPIKEMVDEQNRFVSDASHELRTPLTSLKSAFEVYLRNKKPTIKKSKTLAKESLVEVNKLQKLAESLLQLAQFKQINGRNAFVQINTEEIIQEAVHKVKNLADKKSIEIKTEIQPFSILGNRDSLVELIVILLDNSIKYSPKKGQVWITTKKDTQQGFITVKDEGVGIDKKDLPHIFDRFYRADTSRNKEKADGYGLGLSIAKQITSEHDGLIEVESQPGKGSTFTVVFPLA